MKEAFAYPQKRTSGISAILSINTILHYIGGKSPIL